MMRKDPRGDYTERIWRYQDNLSEYSRMMFADYTERIWRYQDNAHGRLDSEDRDYTERIWRYQDNYMVTHTLKL